VLVKLDLPPSDGYPDGKQVWIEAEGVDRLEGDTDWRKKRTTIYLKRNPDEPFAVVNKSLPDVADAINQGLTGDGIRDLARAVERLTEELARGRGE